MQAGSDLQNVARSRLPAHAAEHCSTAGGLTCMQTVQTVQLLQTVERVRWRDLIPLSGFQKLNILVVNIFMDHMMGMVVEFGVSLCRVRTCPDYTRVRTVRPEEGAEPGIVRGEERGIRGLEPLTHCFTPLLLSVISHTSRPGLSLSLGSNNYIRTPRLMTPLIRITGAPLTPRFCTESDLGVIINYIMTACSSIAWRPLIA